MASKREKYFVNLRVTLEAQRSKQLKTTDTDIYDMKNCL